MAFFARANWQIQQSGTHRLLYLKKAAALINLICKNSYDHSKNHLTRMWEKTHKNIFDRLFTDEHFEVRPLQALQLI